MSDFVPEGTDPTAGQPEGGQEAGANGGVPTSGAPNSGASNPGANSAQSNPSGVTVPDDLSGLDQAGPAPTEAAGVPAADVDQVTQLQSLVAERTADLQRLQAEYVNYKRRVDRDRELSRSAGAEKVLAELLPTLDAVAMADEHGELTGGFKMVADQLKKVTEKHGLVAFGAVGDEFDPHRHEALMHQQMPGATTTCVSAVMQQGYLLNDRVLRPARVAVSDPDPDAPACN